MQNRKLKSSAGIRKAELISAWGSILMGHAPMLSIEITRECPLECPGCYAYGDMHLGGEITLRELSELRGDELVAGVIGLVRKHRPLHVSLVGGEPLMRKQELNSILPALSRMGVVTMVVTSGVAPIPMEWMDIPRLLIAVSVNGLREDHDLRRKPATYDRILRNIDGRRVNIHWTVTAPMVARQGYIEEYVAFWNARPEVGRIWVSVYTPQVGECTPEILSPHQRRKLVEDLDGLRPRYPKLLMHDGIGRALMQPPASPRDCLFAQMSTNYSADLKTQVEPCIFGGSPDCDQCGCAVSIGLHWLKDIHVLGPLKIEHLVTASMRVGMLCNRLGIRRLRASRWTPPQPAGPRLVQIRI
ncbi:MAG TPA: radical SAM protein [Terriglobales bacterium]|nr:radical SAM protein [Terriglobales bacterium]